MCNPISAKKTVSAIETMYNTSQTFINKSDSPTNTFSTSIRIMEGDTSAPYLFIIIVDYILRQSVYVMDENGLLLNPRTSSETKYSRVD